MNATAGSQAAGVEAIRLLRHLGWQVVTDSNTIRAELPPRCPTPVFRAWGHPRFVRTRPLWGVDAVGQPAAMVSRVKAMWAATPGDLWLLGLSPNLATWSMLADVMTAAPAGSRVLLAGPAEMERGAALSIVSQRSPGSPAATAPSRLTPASTRR